MMNTYQDLEQRLEAEENPLYNTSNLEELFCHDSAVSEAILESGNFDLSKSQLRTLLIEDKIVGFERLIAQYRNLFYLIAYNVLFSYDLAQDAVSEAYIRIYRWLKRPMHQTY